MSSEEKSLEAEVIEIGESNRSVSSLGNSLGTLHDYSKGPVSKEKDCSTNSECKKKDKMSW